MAKTKQKTKEMEYEQIKAPIWKHGEVREIPIEDIEPNPWNLP